MEETQISEVQASMILNTQAQKNIYTQKDQTFLLGSIPSCFTTPEKQANYQHHHHSTGSDTKIVNSCFNSPNGQIGNQDDDEGGGGDDDDDDEGGDDDDDDDDEGGGDGSEQSDLCLSAISESGVVLKDGYSAIGLIIAIFQSGKKVFSSSGVLIANNIILTCAHAFENQEEQYCDYFIFVPGCSTLTDLNKFKKNVFRKDMLLTTSTMNKYFRKTIMRELALIRIEEEYDMQHILLPVEIDYIYTRQIEIVGYSNADITYNSQDHTILPKYTQRATLKGQYAQIDRQKHQISYELITSPGLSGAPILAKYINKKGDQIAGIVGIHTHGSKTLTAFSKGLLFTKQMKSNLDTFLHKIEQYESDHDY